MLASIKKHHALVACHLPASFVNMPPNYRSLLQREESAMAVSYSDGIQLHHLRNGDIPRTPF